MPRPARRRVFSPAADPSLARRRAALAAALALGVGGLLGVGCDDGDGDRAARAKLSEAYALRAGAAIDKDYGQMARDVVNGEGGTAATQALANELVGDVAIEQAALLMNGPLQGEGPEDPPESGLIGSATRVLALTDEANGLANAIALGHIYAQGQRARDPAASLQGVNRMIEAVRSAAEGWSPPTTQPAGAQGGAGQGAAMMSIQQTEARAGELQQQLEQFNGQLQQREEQRTQLLRQASQADQASQQQQGEQAVQSFRQVADLRTQAAVVGTEITALQAQIRQATADLQESQALQASLQQGVVAFEGQRDALATRWDAIQQQIERINQTNRATYAGGDNVGRSVESVARELSAELTRMDGLQAEVLKLLGQSGEAYEAAQTKVAGATRVGRDFSEAFKAAFDADRMRLGSASAARQAGMVHAGRAATMASLVRLQETLKAGGQELPGTLPADPSGEYRAAVESAAASLANADTILLEVLGNAQGPVAEAAVTLRAVLLSDLSALRSLVEGVGVETGAQIMSAEELRAEMQKVADEAQRTNAILPAVPGFAGARSGGTSGEASTTQPAGDEPATQPTTQPADEGGDEPDGEPMGDEPPPSGDEPPEGDGGR